MPVYDFRCPKCGLEFEVSRPRSEAGNPALCPQDGTEGIRNFGSVAILRTGGESDSASDGDGGLDDGHGHGPGSHMH